MQLRVDTFTLGPLGNNSYLLWVEETKHAVLIDPSYDTQIIVEEIMFRKLILDEVWITHAHFDHIIGIPVLINSLEFPPRIGLHPADLDLWRTDAGAEPFYLPISLPQNPDFFFKDENCIKLGDIVVKILHIPGHTPGHVVFYIPENKIIFCGDVIFHHSVGRTDLPGSNFDLLIAGINKKIFMLPLETRILSGHGTETTVAEEKKNNPFLKQKEW